MRIWGGTFQPWALALCHQIWEWLNSGMSRSGAAVSGLDLTAVEVKTSSTGFRS